MPTGYSKNFQSLVYDPDLIKLIKASDRKMPDTTGKSATFGAGSISGLITLSTTSSEFLLDGAVYKYDANGTNGQYDFFGFNVALLPAHKGAARSVTALMHTENITTQNIVFAVKYIGGTRDGQIVKVYVENMEAPNTVKTVFDIPSDVTSIVLLFQNLSTATNARIFLDNILVEMNPFKYIQLDSWTQYDLTVTGTGWATTRAKGTPYKTKDGTWRLRGNIAGNATSATRTQYSVTISGIVSAAVQVISGISNASIGLNQAYIDGGNTLTVTHASTTTAGYYFSFDIELAGRPTFSTDTNEYVVVSWQPGMDGWAPYTPIINGFGTPTNVDFVYRKKDTDIEIMGTFTSGVTTPVYPNFSMPSGLNRIPYTSFRVIGHSQVASSGGVGYVNNAPLLLDTGTNNSIYFQANSVAGVALNTNATSIASNGNTISIKATIPIQGWKTSPALLALPTSKENNKTYDQTQVTVTGTNTWVTDKASFYPYRTISKTTGLPVWRMSFNIYGTTASTSRTTQDITISGVTFPSRIQAIPASQGAGTSPFYAWTAANSGNVNFAYGTTSANYFSYSGDVELSAKPTWADEWTEPGVFVGNVQKEWQYDLTVTGTSWTTLRAKGIPYQTADGAWRLKFNVVGSVTSASRANYTAAISGVVFKNITSFYQSISASPTSNLTMQQAYATFNTGNLVCEHASGTTTQYTYSGDVELEAKPIWAVNS
jgi:hypothetical protein